MLVLSRSVFNLAIYVMFCTNTFILMMTVPVERLSQCKYILRVVFKFFVLEVFGPITVGVYFSTSLQVF